MYLTRSARIWSVVGIGVICLSLFEFIIPGFQAAVFEGSGSGWITGAGGVLLVLGGAAAAYVGYRIDLREAQNRDPED